MEYIIAKPLSIHELGQRANQEDSLYPVSSALNDGSRFFILCDGMGGHESGEVASSTVCEAMGSCFTANPMNGMLKREQFEQALNAAYDALDAKDNPDTEKKMGTTMTFLCLHSGGVTAAHIGDSRIYQIRPGESLPIFRTRDHSLVNDLIRLGEMTEEEARTSKNRNIITRAMQPSQERRAKADISLLTDVRPEDWFYMCSDGMLEQMEDSELVSILTDPSKSDEEKRQILIDRTTGNKDNHTAFLIHVLDVKGTPEQTGNDMTEEIPVVAALDEDNETPEPGTAPASHQENVSPVPVEPGNGTGLPAQRKSSHLSLAIILAAVLALAGAAYWYLSKNGNVAETPAGSPSTPVTEPVSNGTAGQATQPSTATQKPVGAQYFNGSQNETGEAGHRFFQ